MSMTELQHEADAWWRRGSRSTTTIGGWMMFHHDVGSCSKDGGRALINDSQEWLPKQGETEKG